MNVFHNSSIYQGFNADCLIRVQNPQFYIVVDRFQVHIVQKLCRTPLYM